MEARQGAALSGFIDALLDDDAEQLYDRAPCGYLSTTPDGTIIKVNQTLLALTGYEREELVGRRRFAELLSRGGQIYHETHFSPMLRMHGEAHEIALTLVRSDGQRMPVLVNSVLDRGEDGSPRVVRTAVFDATQRRQYERELMAAKDRAEASEAHASDLARTLQQSLIPPTPPVVPDLEVAARYRPAGDGSEVGGDFYDVFQVGPGDWVAAIGDVCGKGVEAALVTALVRHTLRAAVVHQPEPSQALRLLNEVLLLHGTDRFCTVGLLRLRQDDDGWRVVVSSGGHPLPLLRTPDGSLRSVGRPGTLIGVVEQLDVHDVELRLQPGETLTLYTDGVTEGRTNGEFYGEQRIAAVLAPHATAAELADALLDDVLRYQAGTARDDIAVVVIGVPSSASPSAG